MKKYQNLLTSTTLIPLWAKAVESKEKDPILVDTQAYATLKSLGYDLDYYSKWRQNPSQVGCCLRARWMDVETLKYIHGHPDCQVIQLGAGLDDRFRRIGMPREVVRWYDLDLPEVALMRKEVLPEAERNEIISMDLFDPAWMQRLHATGLSTLIILEGVMMFLDEEKIRTLFQLIVEHLGDAVVLFDSVPQLAVGRAKYHDAVRKYNPSVEYTWGLKEGKDIERLSPHVNMRETVPLSDLPKAYKFCLPLRLLYLIPYFRHRANQLLVRIRIHKMPVQ